MLEKNALSFFREEQTCIPGKALLYYFILWLPYPSNDRADLHILKQESAGIWLFLSCHKCFIVKFKWAASLEFHGQLLRHNDSSFEKNTGQTTRCDILVHPGNRHPLGLSRQGINNVFELLKSLVEVVIDEHTVKVALISSLKLCTIFNSLLEVLILPKR